MGGFVPGSRAVTYSPGLIEWIESKMLGDHNYISREDMNVFTVVDDPGAAARIIIDFKEGPQQSGLDMPPGMKKIPRVT